MRPLVLLIFLAGCAPDAGRPRAAMFGPAEMRLNPTFTRMTGSGVRAHLELLDSAGDLTKGAGRATFEVFEYGEGQADVQGEPAARPRVFELGDAEAQAEHWQAVVRTYRFRLPLDAEPGRRYLLLATYEPVGEGSGRLFDRVVLQPAPRDGG